MCVCMYMQKQLRQYSRSLYRETGSCASRSLTLFHVALMYAVEVYVSYARARVSGNVSILFFFFFLFFLVLVFYFFFFFLLKRLIITGVDG